MTVNPVCVLLAGVAAGAVLAVVFLPAIRDAVCAAVAAADAQHIDDEWDAIHAGTHRA